MIAVGRPSAERDLSGFQVGNPSRAMVGTNAGTFYGTIRGAGCWVFLYQDANGWQYANARCAQATGLIPGPQAMVWVSGCANVRDAPGLSSRVLTCLPNRTIVDVDSAPVYADAYIWWHVAGRGWMSHDFLVEPTASPTKPSGWQTFVNAVLGYTIDLPGDWFAFGRLGDPRSDSFSNERNGGAPLALSQNGVLFNVFRDRTGCPTQPAPSSGQALLVQGQTIILTAPTNFAVPGGEGGAGSRAYVSMSGSCYYFVFQSPQTAALDNVRSALTGIVQSMRPA